MQEDSAVEVFPVADRLVVVLVVVDLLADLEGVDLSLPAIQVITIPLHNHQDLVVTHPHEGILQRVIQILEVTPQVEGMYQG